MQQLRALPALIASLLLVSCGSGGSSSSPPSSSAPSTSASGFVQQYTASATAGEVLTYTIDTNALTYSYKIVYSAYGLTNTTGSGTRMALTPRLKLQIQKSMRSKTVS